MQISAASAMLRSALLAVLASSLVADTLACRPVETECTKKLFELDHDGFELTNCDRIGTPTIRPFSPGTPTPIGTYGGMECFNCAGTWNADTQGSLLTPATIRSLGGGTTSIEVIPTLEPKFSATVEYYRPGHKQSHKRKCNGSAIYSGVNVDGNPRCTIYLIEVKLDEDCFTYYRSKVTVRTPTYWDVMAP